MNEKLEDKAFYIQELRSNGCQCEAWKRPGNSFCWRCYKALPVQLQSRLWLPMGRGYEEAYEAATKYLREEVWI